MVSKAGLVVMELVVELAAAHGTPPSPVVGTDWYTATDNSGNGKVRLWRIVFRIGVISSSSLRFVLRGEKPREPSMSAVADLTNSSDGWTRECPRDGRIERRAVAR
jgi:hypothetical protein